MFLETYSADLEHAKEQLTVFTSQILIWFPIPNLVSLLTMLAKTGGGRLSQLLQQTRLSQLLQQTDKNAGVSKEGGCVCGVSQEGGCVCEQLQEVNDFKHILRYDLNIVY